MEDKNWIEIMNKLEIVRLFSSLYIKKTRKGELTSIQQVDALFRIALKDGITPLELSREMAVSKPMISRLVDQLSVRTMIEKRYDQTDKRSYSLWVTADGRQELDCMCKYYLGPVYELERKMDQDSLHQLYRLISEANEILNVNRREE